MKSKVMLSVLMLTCMALCLNTIPAWGETTTLFHETFGDNSGSARDWEESYSVKSGIEAVYQGITGYTITNAKQSKNTVGQTTSGLAQSSMNTDAVLIIGPLNVSSYSDLTLSYYWKAGSTKGTYSTSVYYATSSTATYTEVTKTSGTGATTFVECKYSLPTAAQVSTLYLKIVWNTSNTQAVIDEVDLTGAGSSGGVTYTDNFLQQAGTHTTPTCRGKRSRYVPPAHPNKSHLHLHETPIKLVTRQCFNGSLHGF